ncbi:MAG: SGNH/GDSL hydrolase family protein, partial [Chloroflexota bacterium]
STMVTEEFEPPAVNGIPIDSIVVFPEEVAENVRQIFERGQAVGRDAHAFSKLGDSLIATPTFLTKFDVGPYNLGPYDYLQPTIDYYAGSYQRYGVALRPGLHAWGVFDPLWANKEWCQPNENLLACEFRLNNPSVVLILLGTNDAGNPPGFAKNMRQVVEFSMENGVIPVLVTKADRFEGPDNTNNNILRQIAADYQIPLWDFDLVAETIPGRGLSEDQVHLTVFVENDYTMPEAFQTGTGVHNLTGLMALDAVRRAIVEQ